MKWSAFSKYESTWEASDDISDDCIWLVLASFNIIKVKDIA